MIRYGLLLFCGLVSIFGAGTFTDDTKLPRMNGIALLPSDISRLPAATIVGDTDLFLIRVGSVSHYITGLELKTAVSSGVNPGDRFIPFNNAGTWANSPFYVPIPADDSNNWFKLTNSSGVFLRQTVGGSLITSIGDESKYLIIDPAGGRFTSFQSGFGASYIQLSGLGGVNIVPYTGGGLSAGFGTVLIGPGGGVTINHTMNASWDPVYTNAFGLDILESRLADVTHKNNRTPNVRWTTHGWDTGKVNPIGGFQMEFLEFVQLSDLSDATQSRWVLGALSNAVAASWKTLAQFDLAGNAYFTANQKLFLNESQNVFIVTGLGSPEGSLTAGPGSIFLSRNGGSGATTYGKETGSGNTGWIAYGAGGVSSARAVNTSGSLTGGGDLSADRTHTLVNDNATPGNNKYYGTDSGGTKGFFPLVAGGTDELFVSDTGVTTDGTTPVTILTFAGGRSFAFEVTAIADWNSGMSYGAYTYKGRGMLRNNGPGSAGIASLEGSPLSISDGVTPVSVVISSVTATQGGLKVICTGEAGKTVTWKISCRYTTL